MHSKFKQSVTLRMGDRHWSACLYDCTFFYFNSWSKIPTLLYKINTIFLAKSDVLALGIDSRERSTKSKYFVKPDKHLLNIKLSPASLTMEAYILVLFTFTVACQLSSGLPYN